MISLLPFGKNLLIICAIITPRQRISPSTLLLALVIEICLPADDLIIMLPIVSGIGPHPSLSKILLWLRALARDLELPDGIL